GDWVVIRQKDEENRAKIFAVLPRKSKFSRRAAGQKEEEQVVAANIDLVFLVSGLDNDFNPRRMERYIILAKENGVTPVIVLNKADICENLEERIEEVGNIALDTPIVSVSTITGYGIDKLKSFVTPNSTIALLGSSGVGKSSIINCLVGDQMQRVQEVREHDDRGKHTTTNRELIRLPTGALIIDTPGMRELQVSIANDGFYSAFEDVEAIASECRFSNCAHQNEPGCAIKTALEDGSLDQERFSNYLKIQQELGQKMAEHDYRAARLKKEKIKKMNNLFKKTSKKW
ncbi:MAG: ribosome small subunit-dependent GTPase A, partial [Blastocatellia bacterium]|nr:ribosome small subunit-dependent GTPase A [Blastocatellia bacterium]